jgi:hypothetical protein
MAGAGFAHCCPAIRAAHSALRGMIVCSMLPRHQIVTQEHKSAACNFV